MYACHVCELGREPVCGVLLKHNSPLCGSAYRARARWIIEHSVQAPLHQKGPHDAAPGGVAPLISHDINQSLTWPPTDSVVALCSYERRRYFTCRSNDRRVTTIYIIIVIPSLSFQSEIFLSHESEIQFGVRRNARRHASIRLAQKCSGGSHQSDGYYFHWKASWTTLQFPGQFMGDRLAGQTATKTPCPSLAIF